jgi:hypothetical protein
VNLPRVVEREDDVVVDKLSHTYFSKYLIADLSTVISSFN